MSAAELGAEPAERVGVLVDDRDRVPARLEAVRERRADPAAAHDHDVHRAPPASRRRASTQSVPCAGRGDRVAAGAAITRAVTAARPYPWRLWPVRPRSLKRLLLGRPFRSDRLQHTLLPKRIALPVFASDALSTVAYAPDEILLTLSIAGAAAFVYSPWSRWRSSVVMVTVVASYRQNVHAYPSGGGDYEVATVNLGPRFGAGGGQRAAGRLRPHGRGVGLPPGVANLGSVVPFVAEHKVGIAVGRGRRADRAQPARHPGVGHGVRHPDVRVHRSSIVGMILHRAWSGSSCSATTCGRPAPAWTIARRARTHLDRLRVRRSCCCGRSPPAAPR